MRYGQGPLLFLLALPTAWAQLAEPILTKSALPFPAGAGSLKLDFASGIGRAGGASQALPEGILEVGGPGSGLEFLVRFPLLRVNRGPQEATVLAGGQLAMGARYVLIGGPSRTYAVAVQGIVEVPTGSSELDGDSTQIIPTVLAEWRPIRHTTIYSNLSLDRPIGGRGPKAGFLEYSNAVTWSGLNHIVPAFELTGSTNTMTGRTELVALPEVLGAIGTHLEWKVGLQLGLIARTPRLGLRTQISWSWGGRLLEGLYRRDH
jgi:hypothetical protein